MNNIPRLNWGIVAVSRDCFPIDLSIERRKAVVAACQAAGVEITEIQTTIENEEHALKALEELKAAGLQRPGGVPGQLWPEGPETYLAERFGQPCMFCAAAEENIPVLSGRRGDAYCGMLNASYSIKLRGFRPTSPRIR